MTPANGSGNTCGTRATPSSWSWGFWPTPLCFGFFCGIKTPSQPHRWVQPESSGLRRPTKGLPGSPLLENQREISHIRSQVHQQSIKSNVSSCLEGPGAQPCCHESHLLVCNPCQFHREAFIQFIRYLVFFFCVILPRWHSYCKSLA